MGKRGFGPASRGAWGVASLLLAATAAALATPPAASANPSGSGAAPLSESAGPGNERGEKPSENLRLGSSCAGYSPEPLLSAEDESPVKKVELVVLEAGNPGIVRVGFHVELEPGWHLYWANPGDAGLAPGARWSLPPGLAAGPLRHPVPEKAVEEGLVAYRHEGEVLLVCDIVAGAPNEARGTWEAAAVLEWMACRESCLTGETSVKLEFPPDVEAREKGRALIARFAARFPRPAAEARLIPGPGRAEWTGSSWRVEIALAGPGAAGAEDFFVCPLDGYVIENAGISCRDGKIVVPVIPSGGAGSPPPETVRGIVLVGGAGFEITATIEARQRDSGDPRSGRHVPKRRTPYVPATGDTSENRLKRADAQPSLTTSDFLLERTFPEMNLSADRAAAAAPRTHIIRTLEGTS